MTSSKVDQKTVEYFDRETPEYSDERLTPVFPFLSSNATPESRLLDIGCGVGNLLREIRAHTPIQHVTGMDASRKCLEKTRQSLDCSALHGSVLDTDFMTGIGATFDFVVLAAILHHLVGKTRRECKRNFLLAVENALTVTRPGGHVIIYEPGISPRLSGFLLFYAKRLVTTFTSQRVQLFDKWNNIGAPVISYFTDAQILSMATKSGRARLVEHQVEDERVNLLWRLCGITRRTNTTLIMERIETG